jgi:UDP-glucose 4-epimerase
MDNLTTGRITNLTRAMKSGRVEFLKCSITSKEGAYRAAKGVSTVFHHAALVSVPESFDNPHVVHRVNVEGSLNLLEACRRYDIARFVYASSSSIYGRTSNRPVREDVPLKPISPYAVSKLAAEEYCRTYWRAYGLATVSLRYFNVYGPRQTGGTYSGVISIFAKALSKGEPLTINGDGNQTRDFVYVGDVVKANLNALKARRVEGEALNIGSGKATSINELSRVMLRLSGHHDPKVKHAPMRQGDMPHSCADITRAVSRLRHKPKTRLQEGIQQVLEFFR